MIEKLFVLYDAECGFCRRCREWMLEQAKFLDVAFIPRASLAARLRFGDVTTTDDDELVVVDDQGGLYRGPSAFLMCLYALRDYRAWSLRLASPTLLPLARKGFELVSARRHRINDWLGLANDIEIARQLASAVRSEAPRCVGPRT